MGVDVTSLQHFVTIALATAAGGEGDYARDLLSSLRTVGGGFEELIYKLPPSTGYKELERKCNVLWETLRNTPDLPDLLVCHLVQLTQQFLHIFEFLANYYIM